MSGHHSILFDTSIATDNAGDEIIMDAVQKELHNTVGDHFWVRLPTHDYIGRVGRRWVRDARFCVVGGTNLLSSNYPKYRQWKITPIDAVSLAEKVILMGVGWWQYQNPPDAVTALLYRNILCRNENIVHSVRDEYTRTMLSGIGITNVVNTGCPTMWSLNAESCKRIPSRRGESVLLTITDYNKKPDLDRSLIQTLTSRYREVFAWPQGIGDHAYLRELGLTNLIKPGLHSLDEALSIPGIDYVGTRLHAGIRALQHGRRSVVIAVDNRASEISKDTGLWVVQRENPQSLVELLEADTHTNLSLPEVAIESWRASMARALSNAERSRKSSTSLPNFR